MSTKSKQENKTTTMKIDKKFKPYDNRIKIARVFENKLVKFRFAKKFFFKNS